MSRRVAYLTGRSWRGRPMPPEALPEIEAPDHALIAAAAAERGLELVVRYWDDPTLPEQRFDGALIRSCWDYVPDPDRFIAALTRLEAANVRVFNAAATVAWNARKRYLEQLGEAGVPIIPTIWVDRLEPLAVARAFEGFNAAEIVAKPQTGAGGDRTIRLNRANWGQGDLARGPLGPAMLQPYLASVEGAGEASLFFFAGALAHAIRKRPPDGGWLANARDARFEAFTPSPRQSDVAFAAVAAAPSAMLYARVDLLEAAEGPVLIELEAIEPYLFLAFAPWAAARFADALADALA